jgi:RecA-family ATPase
MIVFDPISSFWGSEAALNDMNKAVTRFMSDLTERSGACVEMINHMGKQSSNQKDMTQFAGRGGSGLPSNARVSRALRSVFDDEYADLTGGEQLQDKQSAMLCNVNKFTDGSPLYNKPFLILRDGYLFMRKTLTDTKAREAEKNLSDIERVFAFVKECRQADKFPTVKIVQAHFMTNGNPITKASVDRALEMLGFQGHIGEKLRLVENPDATIKDKVFVITDLDGREQ